MTQSTGKIIQRRWNYANRFIPKKSVKILSQWHCNHHKFHTGRHGFESGAGQHEAGD